MDLTGWDVVGIFIMVILGCFVAGFIEALQEQRRNKKKEKGYGGDTR